MVGVSTGGKKKFYEDWPYFEDDAARYLVEQGVEMLGLDTPSPDDSRISMGSSEDSKVHKIFLAKKVILVEYIANLDLITDYEGWSVIALPIKVKGSDGAPSRVCLVRGEFE